MISAPNKNVTCQLPQIHTGKPSDKKRTVNIWRSHSLSRCGRGGGWGRINFYYGIASIIVSSLAYVRPCSSSHQTPCSASCWYVEVSSIVLRLKYDRSRSTHSYRRWYLSQIPLVLSADALHLRISQVQKPRCKACLYFFYHPPQTRALFRSSNIYSYTKHVPPNSKSFNLHHASSFLSHQLNASLPHFSIYPILSLNSIWLKSITLELYR